MLRILCAALLLARVQCRFGTEGPLMPAPDPDMWHHEGLTRRAAGGVMRPGDGPPTPAFSAEAVNALAFHADWVDSYAYNVEWWLNPLHGGGPDRALVALSTYSELAKLHFDDLFSAREITATWRRYLSGTLCGLEWVAACDLPPRLKVSCAQNIIGASLHALQDFYSHSNWVDDPTRRGSTWFDVDTERMDAWLYTGSYESAAQHGVHEHGVLELWCSLLRTVPLGEELLEIVCDAGSPLRKSAMCDNYRRCRTAQPVSLPLFEGVTLPEGVAYVSTGMNLDSYWQAPVGVRTRGITDMSPAEAFETAYALAERTSCQWLHLLQALCTSNPLLAPLWQDLTSQGVGHADYRSDTEPWERFDLLPYGFLTAGDYPTHADDDTRWYVRLEIWTGNDSQANTNGAIEAALSGGPSQLLDHGPKPSGVGMSDLRGHNDFTKGSVAVYDAGWCTQLPPRVRLTNTAPGLGTVLLAIAKALVDAVVSFLESVVDFLKSLIGWHPDFVGQAKAIIPPHVLDALVPGGSSHAFTIDVDGQSEGHYRLHGEVAATATTTTLPNLTPARDYVVSMLRLECVEESNLDGLSNSDEIFFVGLVNVHGSGRPGESWRSRKFDGDDAFDAGSVRDIGRTFTVTVPRKHGFLTLPIAVWESDLETTEERDEIQASFAAGMAGRLQAEEASLYSQIGASMGQAWQLGAVRVTAFRRNYEAEVVLYERHLVDQWIDGQESYEFYPPPAGPTLRVKVPDRYDSPACAGIIGPGGEPTREPIDNPDHDPTAPPYSPGIDEWP
jgi:hypothetical protein